VRKLVRKMPKVHHSRRRALATKVSPRVGKGAHHSAFARGQNRLRAPCRTNAGRIVACTLAATFACYPASGEEPAPFYKGKQITIVVGTSAGGGYDTYARLIARHMPKHIAGNPGVIVSNMPGAGSNIAANHLYYAAPKDGTFIGALQGTAVVEPLFGSTPIKHDPSKFEYLGSANNDVYICVVRSDAGVNSFADVLRKEVIAGASNQSSTADFSTLLDNVIGAKLKVVAGYAGSREISLAMEKGEVQAVCGVAWPSYRVTNPGWFESGFVKAIVQLNARGYPELNAAGVPLAVDFARTPEQRAIMELYFGQTKFGRPYVAAPDVPKGRVAILRTAFTETLRDADLIGEANRLALDVDQVSGDELQALVAKMYLAPPELIAKTKQAILRRK
jgi:tripartite-type tricarboxylate transporter receptor subunit TctC